MCSEEFRRVKMPGSKPASPIDLPIADGVLRDVIGTHCYLVVRKVPREGVVDVSIERVTLKVQVRAGWVGVCGVASYGVEFYETDLSMVCAKEETARRRAMEVIDGLRGCETVGRGWAESAFDQLQLWAEIDGVTLGDVSELASLLSDHVAGCVDGE